MIIVAFVTLFDRAKSKYMFPNQKDTHRKMTQIGVIGSSRTLTGSRLVTKPILAKKCRLAKFVISQAGNSETCQPPNKKTLNLTQNIVCFVFCRILHPGGFGSVENAPTGVAIICLQFRQF